MMMMIPDVSSPTVIFSLIMLIPILRIKHDLCKFFKDIISFYAIDESESVCQPDLPIIRFEDLQARRHHSVDDMCFVCSAEYDVDDVVSQLGRCKHVFHTRCLLEAQRGKHMSCPFCRNPLFIEPTASSSCKYG